MLSGWNTHFFLSHPICIKYNKGFYLKEGRKLAFFICHQQWLDKNHPFRKNKKSFGKGKAKNSTSPQRLIWIDIWERTFLLLKVNRYKMGKLLGFKEEHN